MEIIEINPVGNFETWNLSKIKELKKIKLAIT